MARPTRTVDCPKCGTSKETRAFGGLALRCANPECRTLFECPAMEPGELSPSTTEDNATTARTSTTEDATRGGGVKVKRASGVKASPPPAPPSASEPEPKPEAPPPLPPAARRPRSHRRGWARP